MIIIDTSKSMEDYLAILNLQEINLETSISKHEVKSQGFVTVKHDLNLLNSMSGAYHHIIAKSDDKLIGYCLVMLKEFASNIPILVPMFHMIENLSWDNVQLSKKRFFVMGQVCIAKDYRSKGVFQKMYKQLFLEMRADFDFVITEVASRNIRSIRAHEKVGFQLLQEYQTDNEDWSLIIRKI